MKTAALLLLMFSTSNQKIVAVWGAGCLGAVALTERSEMIAPVDKNGDPIMSELHITHLQITYGSNCRAYRIEKQ